MTSPTLQFGLTLAAVALLASTLQGADLAVGRTGLVLSIPDGFENVDDPEGGLLLEAREKGGGGRIAALRFDSGATGQHMSEEFELRMRSRFKRIVLTAQERVTILGAGAMCRTYRDGSGESHTEVEAVIFVRGNHRLVLYSSGPVGTAKKLRKALLSLRPGAESAAADPPADPTPAVPGEEEAPPGQEPPPDAVLPKSPEPPRTAPAIRLPGTVASILPPADWRGGPHAPTKGVRIVDPDRACIIDISSAKLGNRERNDAAVEKAADDFEMRLAKEPARWKRVENRRERVGGQIARVRRFEGAPGDLPCDFLLLVTRVGGHMIIARSIYPQVHRERFREHVLSSLRSIARR